jgi:hypothetical protein
VYTDSDSDYARLREGLVISNRGDTPPQDWAEVGASTPPQDLAGVGTSKTIDTDKTADAGADTGRGRRSRRGRQAPAQGVVTSGASKSRREGKALGGKKNAPSGFSSGKQPLRKGKVPERTTLCKTTIRLHNFADITI